MIIKMTLPANGVAGIKAGEVYEDKAFSDQQLAEARLIWRIQKGTITDAGPHKGQVVIGIISAKEKN